MSRKLYYENCHLKEFTARVTACRQAENGFLVELDQTAFYPEGGGQASDIGYLEDARVLHCHEEGEALVHLCDQPLTPGQTVRGTLDWPHRFDLMQQHTGEHILSGLIHERFGFQNSGFHVGQQVMEVDFDGPIPQEALAQLEMEANRRIWENIPVHCFYPSREELPHIPYRTKRALPWPVRIVQIPGVDSCACCGVHTETTGEVGLLKILSCVKFHGGVRLELVCGERAYRYVRRVCDQSSGVSQLLSAKMPDILPAVQQLSLALEAEKNRCANMEKKLCHMIADSRRGTGNTVAFVSDFSGAGVLLLAQQLCKSTGGCAVVFQGSDANGYRITISTSDGSAKRIGAAVCDALRGRGGGKTDSFSGFVAAGRDEIVACFGETPNKFSAGVWQFISLSLSV